MSDYFDGYKEQSNSIKHTLYDHSSQFTRDDEMNDYFTGFKDESNEIAEIKKYDYENDDEESDSDTKIFKFTNKYSMGGLACVIMIILIIMIYIYFNYWKK